MRECALLLLILPKGPDRRAKIFIRTADSHILPMSQLLLLGKFEYGGGLIFKVVLEC